MAGEVFSSLITSINPKIMNSGSRRGIAIDRIILHHNAATNKNVAMNTWLQGGAAGTSAHYEITPTEIIGCVGEQYAAWHAGGTGPADPPRIANPNQRSIGIENLNSTGAPNWSLDPRTIKNCARLVADICKRYNIPCDRRHVLGHNEVTSTACPGGMNVDEVVRLAKQYLIGGSVSTPSTPNKPQNTLTAGSGYSVLVDGKGNKAHLDEYGPINGKLRVRGWHIANYKYEYLILIDRVTGKEVARKLAKGVTRPDVNKAYKTSGKVGFDESFDLKPLKGKSIVVLMRATNDPKGNTSGGFNDLTETRWYHDIK